MKKNVKYSEFNGSFYCEIETPSTKKGFINIETTIASKFGYVSHYTETLKQNEICENGTPITEKQFFDKLATFKESNFTQSALNWYKQIKNN